MPTPFRRPALLCAATLALVLSVGALPAPATGPLGGPVAPQQQLGPADADRTTTTLSRGPALSTLTADRPGGLAEATGTTLAGQSAIAPGVTVVGVRWQGPGLESEHAVASMRVRTGEGWGDWQSLGAALPAGREDSGSPSAVAEDGPTDWATEGALVLDAAEVQVELTGAVDGAELEVWTTPVTEQDSAVSAAVPPVAPGAASLQIATRGQWAADEGWRNVSPLFAPTPKLGVTVHHTAGTNGYSPEMVPAILRGIYYYHAVSLDWGDIGYHALVDQQGRVWEGRAGGLERNIRGAHAFGMNTDWFGVAVLGNHEEVAVTPAEMQGLAAASAWALDVNGASVHDQLEYTNEYLGWTRVLSTVHGHGEVGQTLCPGRHLISVFGQLRTRVAQEQARDRLAVQRVGGAQRYATAARLARDANLHGTTTAYLARGEGEDLVDALPAGTVAARTGSALLLTRDGELPPATAQAITDLGVQEVVAVGDPRVLSGPAAAALEAQGLTVRRLGSADRYQTAVALSRETDGLPVPDQPSTVYLASGTVLADGLGGAAAAAHRESSLLLTEPGRLTPVTQERLQELAPARVVVLGGTEALAGRVADEVRAALPLATVDRIGGTNRYVTSAQLAQDTFPEASSAVVAAGPALVDAMASTQLAADRSGPVLLARQRCLPGAVGASMQALGVDLVRLAGGTDVLHADAPVRTC